MSVWDDPGEYFKQQGGQIPFKKVIKLEFY